MFIKQAMTLLISLTALCQIAYAQSDQPSITLEGSPGLLLTKTRVELEGRARSDAISISNNGKVPGVYRIELINKRMNEDGSIVAAETAREGELFADEILRIAPRRVTIAPGDTQKIRVLARKPKNLAEGEYRSHLLISAERIEESVSPFSDKPSDDNNQLSIIMQANFSVSIPIIIRHGELSYQSNISDIVIGNPAPNVQDITFIIHRNGTRSTYGDIQIVHTDIAGKETVLKTMAGLAVYTPTKKRTIRVPLDIPKGFNPKGGTITVTYTEKEKQGGKIIAQQVTNY